MTETLCSAFARASVRMRLRTSVGVGGNNGIVHGLN
jgi:hypothetical protein